LRELSSALEETAKHARLLRLELDAVRETIPLKRLERALTTKLENLSSAKSACLKAINAVPLEISTEEKETTELLDRAKQFVAEHDPPALARRRRAEAVNTPTEQVHKQIAAPTRRMVRLSDFALYNLISPPELIPSLRAGGDLADVEAFDYRSIDDAERVIRRAFIPYVIRRLYKAVIQIESTVLNQNKAQCAASWQAIPEGDELEQCKRKTSECLHRLTADTVRAFYPTWGAFVTPKRVRQTIENARKVRKK
jgi:hypothetical protein